MSAQLPVSLSDGTQPTLQLFRAETLAGEHVSVVTESSVLAQGFLSLRPCFLCLQGYREAVGGAQQLGL